MTKQIEPSTLSTSQLMANALETPEQIQGADTAVLRQQLANSLTLTARTLKYLALIWQELEKRGEDLSDLRTGLAVYLPQIADGTLDAAFVVKYAGQRMLMQAAGKLPLEEQSRLAAEGMVELVRLNESDDIVKEQVSLHRLSSRDVRYVFSEDHLRSAKEQLKMRENESKREEKKPPTRTVRVAKVNDKTEMLAIGGRRIKIEAVVDALSQFYDLDLKTLVRVALDARD